MRLTLRTMLAYLDDILEPEDREEIGQKIKESEFATELVHRMRDMMGRLRLGAPPVLGRGMGQDANTVAEYLDNSLAPERVADFERACLESDIQLAEAAACHQILTLVLGEAAEIDPDMRTRMYAICEQAEQILQRRADLPHGVAAAQSVANETSRRQKPEVPDYLRESARARKRRVLAMLIVAATILAVAAFFDPLGLLTGGEGGNVADRGQMANDPAPLDDAAPPKVETEAKVETVPTEPTSPADVALVEQSEHTPAPATEPPAAIEPMDEPLEGISAKIPVDNDGDAETDGSIELPPDDELSDEVADAAVDGTETSPPVNETLVGTYGDQKLILLRYENEISEWRRLPTRAAVHAKDRLLALPTFRPSISLGNGALVEIIGGTLIVFPRRTEPQTIDVTYGRVIVTNTTPNVVRLVLLGLAADRATVDLLPQATLAIDVRRHNIPGADPRLESGTVTSQINAVSGTIDWGDGDDQRRFEAPDVWYLQSGTLRASDEASDAPVWTQGERLNKLDQLASFTLEQTMELNRSARLTLRELMEGRSKEEVRSLAARCSLYVGEFEPFVEALSDLEIAPAWRPKLIEALRGAMALGPDVAEQIRLAFVQARGEQDGEALYELLWRYTSKQLEEGQKQQLVEYLQHDRLEFRLLALWNLFEFTGQGSTDRLPDPEANRQQLVRRWEDRLKEGRVVPKAQGK